MRGCSCEETAFNFVSQLGRERSLPPHAGGEGQVPRRKDVRDDNRQATRGNGRVPDERCHASPCGCERSKIGQRGGPRA